MACPLGNFKRESNWIYAYNSEQFSGHSGGPIMYNIGSTFYVIGITTGGHGGTSSSFGTIMTNKVHEFILYALQNY